MFDTVDLVRTERWHAALGEITVSFWRHGRPTPARIGRMLATPAGTDHDRVERVGAWEKIIAWAQAHQCAEIAGFVDDAAQAAARELRGFCVQDAVASAEAEVALILHTTTRTAGSRADDARELAHRFPRTMIALLDGRITLSQARAILDGGSDLDDTQAAALEEQVLGRAGRQTLGQLRESVRRAVLRIDSDAAERRHQRKRRERKVVLYPERDGMATLAATLPAAEAVGVYAVLDHHARACRGEAHPDRVDGGDGRSMDARRADTLVDLVLGETGFSSGGTASARDDAAGDPTAAAASGAADFTEPAPTDSTETCQFPGCRTPAHRCDLDNNVPYDPDADTGPTDRANLGPKCRPHHRLKGMPGWDVCQYPDGTIEWRTPSGHTYTVKPPPLITPAPRQRRSRTTPQHLSDRLRKSSRLARKLLLSRRRTSSSTSPAFRASVTAPPPCAHCGEPMHAGDIDLLPGARLSRLTPHPPAQRPEGVVGGEGAGVASAPAQGTTGDGGRA